MSKEKLQEKFNRYAALTDDNRNDWEKKWYNELKSYSEAHVYLKSKVLNDEYANFAELNEDFKSYEKNKLSFEKNEHEYLDRYLFLHTNGLSTIRQQLIQHNTRHRMRALLSEKFQPIKQILSADTPIKAFNLSHRLIKENKWTVIYRYVRSFFPEKFTSVDAPAKFKHLVKVIKQGYGIKVEGENQIEKNEFLMNLIEGGDVYRKQIFFWLLYDNLLPELDKVDMQVNKTGKKEPLNKILYGPPGTGKTYKLQSLLSDYSTVPTDNNDKDSMLLEIVLNLSWWQVIAFALLELGTVKVEEIYNHPALQTKLKLSNNKNPKNTIWLFLQKHTKEDCEYVKVSKRANRLIFEKDEKSNWSVDKKLVEEIVPDLHEQYEQYKKGEYKNEKNKRYEFVTFHQSYTYEDFIEGIKPKMGEDEDEDDGLDYQIQDGVFKRLCTRASHDLKNNYAIFIDEINRGNIPQIFGELITLIEEDKREGKTDGEELKLTLPYSGDKFVVPPNLYIIGTMNTADRSVEALDTALRRRFSFEEMLPDPEKLKQTIKVGDFDVSLKKLLTTINDRIEVLVDRDHTIGHAFFLSVENWKGLRDVFANKIIPLLQEYFYGDYASMQLVVGKGFVKQKENKVTFAVNHPVQEEELPYEISNSYKMGEDEFKLAIITLLNEA